jgi:tetratricopeptide (TPR) repeat protein
MGWDVGPASAKAEILLYRGLSYRALGKAEDARTYLTRALDFAEAHGFNRTLFAAEVALRDLRDSRTSRPRLELSEAPEEVRQGLHDLREEVVGTAMGSWGPPY